MSAQSGCPERYSRLRSSMTSQYKKYLQGRTSWRLSIMQTLDETLHKPTEDQQRLQTERENAAIRIQKAWRKRMRKRYLGTDFLWKDLAIHARMQVRHNARSQPPVCQAHGRDTG